MFIYLLGLLFSFAGDVCLAVHDSPGHRVQACFLFSVFYDGTNLIHFLIDPRST
jgi:hypothetical protein